MTVSHWLRPHRFTTSDLTADVVVVGAGIAGLSTAYWISEIQPDLKIIILDRAPLGAGASGRNAGFLTKGSASFYKKLSLEWGAQRAKEILEFSEDSLELLYQNILKASPEVKYERTNSLTLFQTEALKDSWTDPGFSPEDFKFDWKKSEELGESLKPNFYGAYETGAEYKVHPVQLLASLKTKLEARKIQLLESLSVFELTADGVRTETNTIRCKQVVLAMNGYLPQFHPAFKEVIRPYRAQMLAVELEDELDSEALHYDPPQRVYWRKSFEKTLLIGGKRVVDEENEQGDFERISPVIQASLESYLRDLLKIKYKIVHRWSGIMGFTDHELPFITRASAAPLDTVVVGGFSGHGMGLGFKSGLEAAELLTGKISQSFFDTFKSVNIKL